ncbi:hypothetical protein BX661DRAFT_11748 [Kickxella alabastrina]|uniref:uncharacterized protein n=1 Tax=Kickxella alabastrina TaxID=61397 RepID=UPI0022206906|nr:uncharacterized protein BX661DRAFT_11748 [Kickxella alabastrina]KAI7835191.1 hypothetical protein BX661DRAFT_11748 [Kickxella alabastrina]
MSKFSKNMRRIVAPRRNAPRDFSLMPPPLPPKNITRKYGVRGSKHGSEHGLRTPLAEISTNAPSTSVRKRAGDKDKDDGKDNGGTVPSSLPLRKPRTSINSGADGFVLDLASSSVEPDHDPLRGATELGDESIPGGSTGNPSTSAGEALCRGAAPIAACPAAESESQILARLKSNFKSDNANGNVDIDELALLFLSHARKRKRNLPQPSHPLQPSNSSLLHSTIVDEVFMLCKTHRSAL